MKQKGRCFHTCPLFLYHFSQSLYVNTLSEISVKKFRAFCALYVKYFVPLSSERQKQPCPGNQEYHQELRFTTS